MIELVAKYLDIQYLNIIPVIILEIYFEVSKEEQSMAVDPIYALHHLFHWNVIPEILFHKLCEAMNGNEVAYLNEIYLEIIEILKGKKTGVN
ncbi:hypothetical protein QL992_05140 [Microbacterium sp. APC 3898]|uniref:Uncharacterized protein n=1 Tax=Planococcus notacanthi TaxID=3035188 RepID=A0ABT7ZL54_9BACL|nr:MULTISPECIES: hypothetical protein [Terrabacteria group]MDN3427874.1 hypothetical protein [Planococcus sp. APC 4016]MDN3498591.1 hypothetical protein [Microbacterium sp. APC 3898]